MCQTPLHIPNRHPTTSLGTRATAGSWYLEDLPSGGMPAAPQGVSHERGSNCAHGWGRHTCTRARAEHQLIPHTTL